MPYGSRAWQGLPELPFAKITSLTGQDVLLQLTFLNSSGVPTQPTSITYEVDSLTTNQNVIPSTSVSPTGSTQILQLPGSQMVNTRNYLGREEFQVYIQSVIPDTNASSGSINVPALAIIELINVSIPA
jgi:hypothetical protein